MTSALQKSHPIKLLRLLRGPVLRRASRNWEKKWRNSRRSWTPSVRQRGWRKSKSRNSVGRHFWRNSSKKRQKRCRKYCKTYRKSTEEAKSANLLLRSMMKSTAEWSCKNLCTNNCSNPSRKSRPASYNSVRKSWRTSEICIDRYLYLRYKTTKRPSWRFSKKRSRCDSVREGLITRVKSIGFRIEVLPTWKWPKERKRKDRIKVG